MEVKRSSFPTSELCVCAAVDLVHVKLYITLLVYTLVFLLVGSKLCCDLWELWVRVGNLLTILHLGQQCCCASWVEGQVAR